MSDTQTAYAKAVERHGANAVAKVTGIPRNTVLSIATGTARNGNVLLAEQRAPMLAGLEQGPRAA